MKTGFLALSVFIFLLGSQRSFANSSKLFRCYKPINPYDLSFEQGQERFLNVYIDNLEKVSFEHFDMSGDLTLLPQGLKVMPTIGKDFTTFSAKWERGFLSMVFLGGDNWGAHLNHQGQQEEFMCQELIKLETL